MNEPIYCGLAFGALSINTRNEYRPCCGIIPNPKFESPDYKDESLSPSQRLNSKDLVDLRQKLIEGKYPYACSLCELNEKNNRQSMRTIWNRDPLVENLPMTPIIDPKTVKYVDLSFGSKCNSKCMTCNEASSDFWIDETNFIFNKKIQRIDPVSIKQPLVEQILDTFINVKKFSFIGGEPMILDEHYEFINKLVITDKAKEIELSYVTNLTMADTKLFDLWKEFKHVSVVSSIDGLGLVNEYIRYPFKWQKIEQNLQTYLEKSDSLNFQLGMMSTTVSLLNFGNLIDLLEYWVKLTNRYYHTHYAQTLANRIGITFNRVLDPEYLQFNILSLEYRQQFLPKLAELKERVKKYDLHFTLYECFAQLENWINEPQVVSKDLINQAVNFITKSDEFRNRHIKDYIPEVWDELLKIQNQYNGN